MLFIKLYIYQNIQKNKVHHNFHKIWRSKIVFNIDNNQKCFLSQINWDYFDTENWSNEENYTLHHMNNIIFYNIFKFKTF